MKKQTKELFLKAMHIIIKGILITPIVLFLIYEAYITENEEASMAHIPYVAIITTLCWGLIFWVFNRYKQKHYIFVMLIFLAFLQMFLFNANIKRAHQLDSCLDNGLIWDYDQHICRNDCLSWNKVQKCIPL